MRFQVSAFGVFSPIHTSEFFYAFLPIIKTKTPGNADKNDSMRRLFCHRLNQYASVLNISYWKRNVSKNVDENDSIWYFVPSPFKHACVFNSPHYKRNVFKTLHFWNRFRNSSISAAFSSVLYVCKYVFMYVFIYRTYHWSFHGGFTILLLGEIERQLVKAPLVAAMVSKNSKNA